MRVTVVAPNVYTEFGISAPIGSTITVGDDYGASLVWSLKAIDTDGVLSEPGNRPFDQVPPQSPVSGGASALADVFSPGNCCIFGDSIAQQNSNVLGDGTANYLSRGPITWMSMILGWPFEWQPSDNYAVFGTTMVAIIAGQLPLIVAAQNAGAKYKLAFCSFGTNDTNGDRPIADIKSDIDTIFDTLLDVGIMPVHTGIRPRGSDASLTTRKAANQHVNEYLYRKFQQGKCLLIDVGQVHADNSTAYGNMLTTSAYDSPPLHPNTRGAYYEGAFLAQWFAARGVRPNMHFADRQSDVFDRTNNPSGVAFALPNPLLQGGTTAPTGMSTSGGTWSKVNRALINGQNRSDPSCALTASTLHYLYDDWVASGAWGATQLQPGDVVELRSQVTLASAANLQYLQLRLSENNGVTSYSSYCAFAGDVVLPDIASQVLYLKSPRHTIRAYGGSGNASVFGRVDLQTAASGAGTYSVQQFELRKLN